MITAFFQKPYKLKQQPIAADIEWDVTEWEIDSNLQKALLFPLYLWA